MGGIHRLGERELEVAAQWHSLLTVGQRAVIEADGRDLGRRLGMKGNRVALASEAERLFGPGDNDPVVRVRHQLRVKLESAWVPDGDGIGNGRRDLEAVLD